METQKRPGKHTSEFWITIILASLLIAGAMAALVTGQLELEQVKELLGWALPMLGGGYAVSRGLAKAGPLKMLVPLVLVLPLAGCGLTFKGALGAAHKGLTAVSAISEPTLGAACRARAKACMGEVTKPEECKPWVECRDIRRKINAGIIAGHRAVKALDQARQAAEQAGLLKKGATK
jgi:hypothetical protein